MSKPTATDRFFELRIKGATIEDAARGAGITKPNQEAMALLHTIQDVLERRLHDGETEWLDETINEWTTKLKDLKRLRKAVYWLREREM